MDKNKIDELTKRVLFNSNRLRELAAAFQRVGNEKVSDELYATAYDLEKGIEAFTEKQFLFRNKREMIWQKL